MGAQFQVENTDFVKLRDVAKCYRVAFPRSLTTAFGEAYVLKTLEWFLLSEQNFLFHVIDIENDNVIGFCGGLINDGKKKRGSASEIIQFSFNEGIWSIVKRPWLLFHAEMRNKYSLAVKNIKKKIMPSITTSTYKPGAIEPYVGLVVIGIDAKYQNKGLSKLMLHEFEGRSRSLGYNKMKLSVKSSNIQAIKAYQKSGWIINEERGNSISMIKR